MTLTLWGRASSVNVQKILWALDELGLTALRIDAGGKFGLVGTDAFAALNPNRRVPVLQDDGFVLWESQAILRYLARREGRLYPEAMRQAALADQWLAFADTTLLPPFITLFWQLVRLPDDRRSDTAIESAAVGLDAAFGVLDGHLRQHEWLTGDTFGIADIAAGSIMHRVGALNLLPPGLDGVTRWADALGDRPGYRTHVAVPFDELRARPG